MLAGVPGSVLCNIDFSVRLQQQTLIASSRLLNSVKLSERRGEAIAQVSNTNSGEHHITTGENQGADRVRMPDYFYQVRSARAVYPAEPILDRPLTCASPIHNCKTVVSITLRRFLARYLRTQAHCKVSCLIENGDQRREKLLFDADGSCEGRPMGRVPSYAVGARLGSECCRAQPRFDGTLESVGLLHRAG